MQYGLFQGAFKDVVIKRYAWYTQKRSQVFLTVEHVIDGITKT